MSTTPGEQLREKIKNSINDAYIAGVQDFPELAMRQNNTLLAVIAEYVKAVKPKSSCIECMEMDNYFDNLLSGLVSDQQEGGGK